MGLSKAIGTAREARYHSAGVYFLLGIPTMQTSERNAALSLGAIMAFRMLGLFMILPVFSLYATHLPHATPTLIGMALGSYGLTQALLQMPLGLLSDRFGRKPIILIGLCLFAAGSVVAACAHSMFGIIVGRIIQGSGAIGSTVLALVADVTRDEERSKAMAIVGALIGASFALAMILGPVIAHLFALSGLFWSMVGLAGLGILLLYTTVPNPPPMKRLQRTSWWTQCTSVLQNRELLKLDATIACAHAAFTATFIGIPILLTQQLGLPIQQMHYFYLMVLGAAFVMIMPLLKLAEKRKQAKGLLLISLGLIVLVEGLLFFTQNTMTVISAGLWLWLFFVGFSCLESSLPAFASRVAPIRYRGTAMGIYSTCQFFGIFVGGGLGGWIFAEWHMAGVFGLSAFFAVLGLIVIYQLQRPLNLQTVILQLPAHPPLALAQLERQLLQWPGVYEVVLEPTEALAYLKYDPQLITEPQLRKQIRQGTL